MYYPQETSAERGRKYNLTLTDGEGRGSDIFKALCAKICPVKSLLSDKTWAIATLP